jgi:hypothetical protein
MQTYEKPDNLFGKNIESSHNQPYEKSFDKPQAYSIRSQPPKRDNEFMDNPSGIGLLSSK